MIFLLITLYRAKAKTATSIVRSPRLNVIFFMVSRLPFVTVKATPKKAKAIAPIRLRPMVSLSMKEANMETIIGMVAVIKPAFMADVCLSDKKNSTW